MNKQSNFEANASHEGWPDAIGTRAYSAHLTIPVHIPTSFSTIQPSYYPTFAKPLVHNEITHSSIISTYGDASMESVKRMHHLFKL